MYRSRNLEALWKKHFRVTRDTFDYICQLIEGDLQKEDTRLRKAVPVYKRVAVALWRLGSENSYRTTGITFGLGKSTVIKICNEFTRARYPVDFAVAYYNFLETLLYISFSRLQKNNVSIS